MQWQQNYGSQGQGSQNMPKPQHNQMSSGHPTANYTLPGVINYLTSEFTNLERFKIMTKLEMSEMKYKIIELQSEINSLKFLNGKQNDKIRLLEAENKRLKGEASGDLQDEKSHNSSNETEIPEIDLSMIKNSRHQLTKSMREIMQLLRTPIANSSSTLNISDSNNDEFAELVHENPADSFIFQDSSELKSHTSDSHKTIFSQYLTQDDLMKPDHTQDWEHSYNENDHLKSLDPVDVNDYSSDPKVKKPTNYESDAETVIYEEPEAEQPVAPIGSIAYVDNNFESSKLFIFGAYITSINYNPEGEEVKIRVSFKTTTCYSNELPSSTLPDPSNILGVYPIVKPEKTVSHILLVYNSGSVYSLYTKSDKVQQLELGIEQTAKSILSSDFTELKTSVSVPSKVYGLVVSCEGKTSSFFNIYALFPGPDNELEAKEIGNYKRLFFKSVVKPSESDRFEFVKWLKKTDSDTKPAKDTSVKKDQDLASTAEESLLASYDILLKLNSSVIKLDLKSKKIDFIFSSSSLQNLAALHIVDGHCLFIEEGPNNSNVAKLFDLTKKVLISQSHYTHKNVMLVKSVSKLRILEIEDDIFSVHDTTFSPMARFKSSFTVSPFSSDENIICLISNNDLHIYDINAWI